MITTTIIWVFILLAVMQGAICSQGTFYHPNVRQDIFLKDDFHYLTVPKVGTYSVYDLFDCTFECLGSSLCFSFNLAAYKGADGKLWCELLSAEKLSNPQEYKENQSSLHFSIKSPCLSSPCQNGGSCVPKYKTQTFDCKCNLGFSGQFCETIKAVNSCKEFYDAYPESNVSQVVNLTLDSKPTPVLCHMGDFGCGDGGWTPVLKIDGNQQTFDYDSVLWSNKLSFNLAGGETGFDTRQTKLPTYWNTPFSKICLGMNISGQRIAFVVINKQANSLYSLIADGSYRATSLGRETWKKLTGLQGSLQPSCNKEGFNAMCSYNSRRARIGIQGNNENDCATCDSAIGFGTVKPITCGDASTRAMGYVLVK